MHKDGAELSQLSRQVSSVEKYLIINKHKLLILEKDRKSRCYNLVLWDFVKNEFNDVKIAIDNRDWLGLTVGLFYFN